MAKTESIVLRSKSTGSLRSRLADELRSFTIGPYNIKDRALARYFGGTPTTSGVAVNEHSALSYSAVWGAVALISDDVASLPLMLYKKLPNGGKDKYETHPLYELLHDRPNPDMTSFVWRRTMQAHLSLWQNAYAEIERDQANRPVAVWPLLPESVTKYYDRGRWRFKVQNPSGSEVVIDDADMLHLVGHSHDGSVGCSLVAQARESLGLGLAAERFGGSFFGNGATFGGVISYKGGRPPELSEKGYRDTLEARHVGVERAHKLLALYNDATFTSVGVEPNKAQFLETRIFQIREVCRWFKIPPHKLADLADATFSNVEQQNIDYFTSCLRPLLELWEQELSRKLISRAERKIQQIEHVTQGLLKADAAGRSALYTAEFNVGSITPNEIRQFEGLDPRPEGDRTYVNAALIPADMLPDYWAAKIESEKAPKVVTPPPDKTDAAVEEIKALREALDLSRHATQLAEDARDIALATHAADVSAREALEQTHAATSEQLRQSDEALEQSTRARREADVRVEMVTSERDALTARVVLVEADYQRVCGELHLEQSEREQERQSHAAVLLEERAATAAVTGDRDALAASVTELEVIKRHQEEEWAKAQAELEAARTAHEADKTEHGKALEVLHGFRRDAEAERDSLSTALETANESNGALILQLAEAQGQQDAVRSELDTVKAKLAGERVDRAADASAHDKAMADAKAMVEFLDTESINRELALNDTIAKLETERDAALKDAAEQSARANAAIVDRDGMREATDADIRKAGAEAETLKTDLARARADIASELEKQRTQKGVLLAAMRSLFVDASERLLQKESDRARKHQATAEKLRAWIGSFYPLHADVCRAAFQPIVGPWTAITGGAPNLLLETLVREHIEASRSAMILVADADDPDQMAAQLERTLYRWEHERADAMADALVREGMAA